MREFQFFESIIEKYIYCVFNNHKTVRFVDERERVFLARPPPLIVTECGDRVSARFEVQHSATALKGQCFLQFLHSSRSGKTRC
jgi:hypothetical protein